jgi:osmoprotectant transport system permease protein
MRHRRRLRAWAPFCALAFTLAALSLSGRLLSGLLSFLFPGNSSLVYPRASLAYLVGEHLALSLVSSLLAAFIGMGAGILATRRDAGTFALVAERLAAIAQTFPPAAVLALAVPALGFGFAPSIAALFLYSVLPILRNTMSGIAAVEAEVLDAARGMGMGGARILRRIELPLAAPVIIAGLRGAVVVNIGTATVGATIGAGGLGAPIVSGLVNQNSSYLVEGALAVSLLALTADALFAAIGSGLAGGTKA